MTGEYNIGRYRFLELKNFCLQYPMWQICYLGIDGWPNRVGTNEGDKTSLDGIKRADLWRNMQMVNDIIEIFCPEEYENYLFKLVTQGVKPKLTRDEEDFWYYYHVFFWELSKRRG